MTTVAVSAWDGDTAVITVDFYIDGRLRTTDALGPYRLKWDTTKAANGLHTIKAAARDLFGNFKAVQRRVSVAN